MDKKNSNDEACSQACMHTQVHMYHIGEHTHTHIHTISDVSIPLK